MQNELLIAILAGFAGMLGWGFADFFAKKSVDSVGSIVSLVWAHFFGTLALVMFAFLNIFVFGGSLNLPGSLAVWFGLIFFGGLQAVVYLFAYEGFGKGKLAVLNPIFASYSGLAAVISIFVYKEAVTSGSILALAIIFAGVVFLSIDLKFFKSKKALNAFGSLGVREVGLAALMAAFWQVYWDKFLGQGDFVIYTLLMYGFMTLTAFLYGKFQNANLNDIKPEIWKYLILVGFCEVIAYLGLSLGFSTTSYTSVVIILAGAFSLPTIILANKFLKEKVSKEQRIGSIMVIIGIALLTILR